MKKIFFSIMFFASSIKIIEAQTALSLNLYFEKDTIDLLTPWSFKLKVLNTSDGNVLVYPLLVSSGYVAEYGEIILEKKHENDSIWENTKLLINRYSHIYSSEKNYCITLHPNERIEGSFFCMPPMQSIRPGKIEVRVSYSLLEGLKQERAISPPVTVYINEYHGNDSLAFGYLKKQPRPEFLLFPLFSMGVDTSDIARAEYLIKKFPKSSLCPYAMLYLNSMYAQKAQNVMLKSKNRDEAIQYLRLSKKYGFGSLEYGNSRMREIAKIVLNGLEMTLFTLYDNSPPLDLELEFTFPFKN